MTLQKPPPPIRDKAHLDHVRGKACCVCGRPPRSAAAHVRFSDFAAGTVNPGMQRKPCDSLTVPLCDPGCHKEAPGSQHDGNERAFWEARGLNPHAIAAGLWIESGAADRHRDAPARPSRKERPRPRKQASGGSKDLNKRVPKRPWASRPFPAGRGFPK